MKIVVIGDIHGRNVWEDIIKAESPDQVIFMGDYFDSYNIPGVYQIYNFQNILKYAEEHTNTILLIGNHDFHYFKHIGRQKTEGYQGGTFPLVVGEILEEHKDKFVMAYEHNNIWFSHAGISPVWLKNCQWEGEPVVYYVNQIWKYKPFWFAYNTEAPDFGSGNHPVHSPIWIRPYALMKANRDVFRNEVIQVVGHTHRKKIDMGISSGGRYYFIDTLSDYGNSQYLCIENNEFTSKTIKPSVIWQSQRRAKRSKRS